MQASSIPYLQGDPGASAASATRRHPPQNLREYSPADLLDLNDADRRGSCISETNGGLLSRASKTRTRSATVFGILSVDLGRLGDTDNIYLMVFEATVELIPNASTMRMRSATGTKGNVKSDVNASDYANTYHEIKPQWDIARQL